MGSNSAHVPLDRRNKNTFVDQKKGSNCAVIVVCQERMCHLTGEIADFTIQGKGNNSALVPIDREITAFVIQAKGSNSALVLIVWGNNCFYDSRQGK